MLQIKTPLEIQSIAASVTALDQLAIQTNQLNSTTNLSGSLVESKALLRNLIQETGNQKEKLATLSEDLIKALFQPESIQVTDSGVNITLVTLNEDETNKRAKYLGQLLRHLDQMFGVARGFFRAMPEAIGDKANEFKKSLEVIKEQVLSLLGAIKASSIEQAIPIAKQLEKRLTLAA